MIALINHQLVDHVSGSRASFIVGASLLLLVWWLLSVELGWRRWHWTLANRPLSKLTCCSPTQHAWRHTTRPFTDFSPSQQSLTYHTTPPRSPQSLQTTSSADAETCDPLDANWGTSGSYYTVGQKLWKLMCVILLIWAFECAGLVWFCKWKPELISLNDFTHFGAS